MTQAEEGTRRRRRRRRGRGESTGESGPAAETKRPAQPAMPDWKFISFPVFFAFVLGIVVMGVVVTDPLMGVVFFIGGLGAVAFGVAHIITRRWIANRRRRG